MAIALPPAPYKTPIADQSGYMAPAWVNWFRDLFNRVGGTSAPSNSEFADSFTDLTSIQTQITTLSNQITALQAKDNDFSQGPEL